MSDIINSKKLPKLSFIKKKHPLGGLKSQVERHSKEAIELIIKTMNDPTQDVKYRVSLAKQLLELQIELTDTISKDNMARLIAEIKLNRGGSNTIDFTTVDEAPKKKRPTLDFDTIRVVT